MLKEIYIVSAKRTPLGGFQGALSSQTAPQLGAVAIQAALTAAGIQPDQVDEVYMGNVISAGVGQAPARQAALKASLPVSTPCTTVSKVCGSGMKSVMLAADAMQLGGVDCVVAGGMESMSLAPYLLPKARAGFRLGHQSTKDSMFVDGLEDADSGRLMGEFGQQTADRFGIGREAMDAFAIESLRRATEATDKAYFTDEIAALEIQGRGGVTTVVEDEQVRTAKPEKIPQLKPAFAKDGTVTAANSSSISDGAAALVLMTEDAMAARGASALAKISAYESHAQKPEEFTLAPIGAMQKLLQKLDWRVDDVDLFEINEAFAVVTMAAMQELGIPRDKVNVNGGACALGHPLGASGARIIVTLVHALRRLDKKRGIASLCIGGGEATAIAVELV
ncbi:acetyl-CoA acetyltransferase [Arenicella chitinivorans]|uniref:Acetyl-CoA acetyltransferase n=2 Tax=Arenicella chitinivorans TaxID=1329800 RepID=A0A918RGN1_9GAMM|nr:thiolase family protein [Arenicella chitinivorans]GGZ98136.1 acetyl-CoA acetyltransferase [Arenicella chitinivorans]